MSEDNLLPLSQAAKQFGIALPALVVAVVNRKVDSQIKTSAKGGMPVYHVTAADMAAFMKDYNEGMMTNILRAANSSVPRRTRKLTEEDLAGRLARRTLEALRDAKELGVDPSELGEEYFK